MRDLRTAHDDYNMIGVQRLGFVAKPTTIVARLETEKVFRIDAERFTTNRSNHRTLITPITQKSPCRRSFSNATSSDCNFVFQTTASTTRLGLPAHHAVTGIDVVNLPRYAAG